MGTPSERRSLSARQAAEPLVSPEGHSRIWTSLAREPRLSTDAHLGHYFRGWVLFGGGPAGHSRQSAVPHHNEVCKTETADLVAALRERRYNGRMSVYFASIRRACP